MQKLDPNKTSDVLIITSMILMALVLRILLFYIPTHDIYVEGVWYDTFLRVGRISAFKNIFYEYTPPFLYLLDVTTLFRFIPRDQAIKLISVLFDLSAAFAVYKIIGVKFPQGKMKWAGFFVLLFTPTVYIESGLWGQSDIIFTSFLLWSFYFILKEKPFPAILLFSIALTIKLQALFFAPIFITLFLNKKFPFLLFITIPLVFFVSVVPAWLAGGPLDQLISIYFTQMMAFTEHLSYNAPNIFLFINTNPYYELKVAIGLAITILIVLAYTFLRWKKWKDMSIVSLCFDAVFFTTIIPFLLPKMHERFFFVAGLFLIILGFFDQKLIWAAFLMQASSLLSFIPYLSGWPVIYAQIGAVINVILVLGLIFFYRDHFSSLQTNQKQLTGIE